MLGCDCVTALTVLNNDPDDRIEKENGEKIRKIKNVIDGQSVTTEIDLFFGVLHESNRLYNMFQDFLSRYGSAEIEVQNSKIKLATPNGLTFSVIPNTGKGGYRAFLQINTDLQLINSQVLKVVDRIRLGQKKKGSVGNERYEVFIQNEEQLHAFMQAIEAQIE